MLVRIVAALVALIGAASCAEARFPRGAPAFPQIHYNIVTDGGATCNNDVQQATITISTTVFGFNITVFSNQFNAGHIGLALVIPGAGNGGGTYSAVINAVTAFDGTSQTLTMSGNTGTAFTSQSVTVTYGSDDADNFKAFNTWALANQGSNNQVVLTIPSGVTCWFGTNQAYPLVNRANAFSSGIKNLIVDGGAGATLTSINGIGYAVGAGRGICQAGLTQGGGCTARIASVSPGSSQVTLTAASFAAGYLSRFSVGKWIIVSGLDVQGMFIAGYGFPPNWTYFEYRQITAIDSGAGVITLDRPLTKEYLSTWPNYNTGTAFEADQGGPATIGVLNDSWAGSFEYRNLTMNQSGQFDALGRHVTFRNMFFPGPGGNCGAFPTQSEVWTATFSNWDLCTIEMDKLVDTVAMDNATVRRIDWQSNSITNLTMTNSSIGSMFGGALYSNISDTNFTTLLRPGSYNYGNSIRFVCTRCNVTAGAYEGLPAGGITMGAQPSILTIGSGTVSWPVIFSRDAAQNWSSAIGSKVFFAAAGYNSIGAFTVLGVSGGEWPAADNQTVTTNVTQNCTTSPKNLGVGSALFTSGDVGKSIIVPGAGSGGGNLYSYITTFVDSQNVTLYTSCTTSQSAVSRQIQWGTSNVTIQTDWTTNLPNYASLSLPNGATIKSNGATEFTCDACTGDPELTSMNVQEGATPLASQGVYVKRSYVNQGSAAGLGAFTSAGRLVSVTVDVTQAYTGSGAGTLWPTNQFHLFTVKQSDWTVFDWWPAINLKQVGTRVFTPGGITCNGVSGGCSGDNITSIPDGQNRVGIPVEAVWIQGGTFNPSVTLQGSGGVNPNFTITTITDQSPP